MLLPWMPSRDAVRGLEPGGLWRAREADSQGRRPQACSAARCVSPNAVRISIGSQTSWSLRASGTGAAGLALSGLNSPTLSVQTAEDQSVLHLHLLKLAPMRRRVAALYLSSELSQWSHRRSVNAVSVTARRGGFLWRRHGQPKQACGFSNDSVRVPTGRMHTMSCAPGPGAQPAAGFSPAAPSPGTLDPELPITRVPRRPQGWATPDLTR